MTRLINLIKQIIDRNNIQIPNPRNGEEAFGTLIKRTSSILQERSFSQIRDTNQHIYQIFDSCSRFSQADFIGEKEVNSHLDLSFHKMSF
uniref:Uncharacterized protein n=1 Tax=Utricularia reniformis TaxID=192314 RepID=A0A1Y0B4K1_9LAMI|nr:hypothetical protein AEK19_MT2173 [Utricularia reniformis]ART32320.1 hypothetical protein AEK19_MT2173 [Utricularia reniformis]